MSAKHLQMYFFIKTIDKKEKKLDIDVYAVETVDDAIKILEALK